MDQGAGSIQIFDFDDYRKFLNAVYLAKKSADKKFSFRYFARLAGLASPSSLKRVINGERNLTAEGIEKFARALKLNKEEREFFEKLVRFNQAKTTVEKQRLAKSLLRARGYKKLHPLTQAQFNCLSHWYFLPIREMVNLPDFREDPKWIAHRLVPQIKPHEAEWALAELIKLNLLIRNEEGRLVQSSTDVTTGDEVLSSAVPKYHKELLEKAAQSFDHTPRHQRDISAMILGLPAAAVPKVKEMVQNFRKEIVEMLSKEDAPLSSIYHLNFQFFPVVTGKDEEPS